ncbi:G-protein coupled receptor 87 [Ambystoma mexicanum]|uniref:G-protein coupled receptor 87 n=1 Tax=Ambystoma mexicanum TaxID=8296 RepID=UPI0037E808EC
MDHNIINPSNLTVDQLGSSSHENELVRIGLPLLYLVIFLGSIFLNGLAAWVFFHIKSTTNFIFYLKNIIVADLLMTLTFPFKIIQTSGIAPWKMNFIVCRYATVLFYTCMYISILFLGLVSIDRYLKVVKPFGNSKMYSMNFTKILAACVWMGMITLTMPNVILTNVWPSQDNPHDCIQFKSPMGVAWHEAVTYIDMFLFIAVLIVLIACYISISRHIRKSTKQFMSSSNRRRKHNQSIRVVVAVFFTCFLPYHLCRIPLMFCHLDTIVEGSSHIIWYYFKEATLFLSACNVCLDPIIYFLMCTSFSQKLFNKSNIKSRSESIRSLHSVRRSEVRVFCEYTEG